MSEVTIIAPRSRHSPCVGVCKLDEATGHCLGCARTGDEIGRWSGMSEAQRDAVWNLLPARHEALSIRMRLMPWMAAELGDWVAETIEARRGTWVTGAPGAVAEFPCTTARDIQVTRNGSQVLAFAEDAAFRLDVQDKLRAFEFGPGGPIVLGLPKARGSLPATKTFAALGADVEAVDPQQRGDQLFDMGVGRAASRFCIRTGDAELIKTLSAFAGRTWAEVMYEAGMAILAAHPHRVVESKLARVEVFAPIPMPGGKSPDGAHTHFLPEFLKTGEESPASVALPEYALPIAIFYPGGGLA